jgi:hypothetical protein
MDEGLEVGENGETKQGYPYDHCSDRAVGHGRYGGGGCVYLV